MRRTAWRLSTRRLMLVVALVGVTLGAIDQAKRFRKLNQARLAFAANQVWLAEGRITVDRFVATSRRVLDAQLPLCWTLRGRITAVRDHLDRTTGPLEAERRADAESLHCHGAYADLAEADESLAESRALLQALLTSAP